MSFQEFKRMDRREAIDLVITASFFMTVGLAALTGVITWIQWILNKLL